MSKDIYNIILAGNPGTGKTHIAIGLGIQACKEGGELLFTHLSLRAERKSTINKGYTRRPTSLYDIKET